MSESSYVKYCPACSAANSKEEAFCANCDADITTTTIEPLRVGQGTSANAEIPEAATIRSTETRRVGADVPATELCILELLENPALRFYIRDGQVVGRTEVADVVLKDVPKRDYISSRMARFFRRGDQWYVQHVACTNFIVVDNERIEDATEMAIYNGTLLNLALTAFRVVLAE